MFLDDNNLWSKLIEKLNDIWNKINTDGITYTAKILNMEIELENDTMFIIFDLDINEKSMVLTDLPPEMLANISQMVEYPSQALNFCISTKNNTIGPFICEELYKSVPTLQSIYDFLIKDLPEDVIVDYHKLSRELLSKMHWETIPQIYKFINNYLLFNKVNIYCL
jgi:hypothetical protein